MNIILTISSVEGLNSGVGGHYYSATTTASALQSAGHNVEIVNFGSKPSPVIRDWPGRSHFISWPNAITLSSIRDFSAVVRDADAQVLHAFDQHSFLLVRLIALRQRLPTVLTIPEGYNPRFGRFFPRARNVVIFASEQVALCNAHRATKNALLVHLPNRVSPFQQDADRISGLKERIDTDALTILRICRVGRIYRRSMIQTLNTARALREAGVRAQALIIGKPVDEEVADEIRSEAGSDDILITESKFYDNARELIDIADAVVGTGRSFMEAASRGKPMLCPARDLAVPYLIDNRIFDSAFAANFSERVSIESIDETVARRNIVDRLGAADQRANLGDQAQAWFHRHFSADRIPEVLEHLYSEGVRESVASLPSLALHAAHVANSFRWNRGRYRHLRGDAAVGVEYGKA